MKSPTSGHDHHNSVPVSGARGRRSASARKKTAAKAGLAVSLGATVVTGLMRGSGARTLHLWSGISLVAFSVWHHSLYNTGHRGNKA